MQIQEWKIQSIQALARNHRFLYRYVKQKREIALRPGQQHLLFKALESTEMSSNLRQSQQEN